MSRRPRGTGTVRLRSDGRWEGRVVVGKDPFGKSIIKTAYGATDQEVFAKLDRLREDHEHNPTGAGKNVSPSFTLQAFVEAYYWPTVRQNITPRTYDRYVLDYGYVASYLARVPLSQILPATVVQTYGKMELAGLTAYQRHKGSKALRRILALAVRMGFLARSPAGGLPMPRFHKEDVHPMLPEQLESFLIANEADRLYALYVTAVDTGARQGELFAVEWSDWNFPARELAFTKAVEDHKGILRVTEPKTRASHRRVVVSEGTAEILEQHRRKMLDESRYHNSMLIFPNVDGNWLRCSNFHRDYWQPALKRARLKSFRFHDLRHTCATLLLMAGDNVNSIADRLGHSSPEMIWRTYGHVLPRMRRESAGLMDQFIKPK